MFETLKDAVGNFGKYLVRQALRLYSVGDRLYTAAEKFVDVHLESVALKVFDYKWRVLLGDAVLSFLLWQLGFGSWALWAHILLLQNWAFTYVSRARNSGSLSRHLKAGFFSNYIWWLSQVIIFTKLFDYLKGQDGVRAAVVVGLFYTACTLTGSILSHAQALRSEKGKTAVGANRKYAQIPVEEWEEMKRQVFWESRMVGESTNKTSPDPGSPAHAACVRSS